MSPHSSQGRLRTAGRAPAVQPPPRRAFARVAAAVCVAAVAAALTPPAAAASSAAAPRPAQPKAGTASDAANSPSRAGEPVSRSADPGQARATERSVRVLRGSAEVVTSARTSVGAQKRLTLKRSSAVRIAEGRIVGGQLRYRESLRLTSDGGERARIDGLTLDLAQQRVTGRLSGRQVELGRFHTVKPRLTSTNELRLNGRAVLSERGARALNSALSRDDLRAGSVLLGLKNRAQLDLPAQRRDELKLNPRSEADGAGGAAGAADEEVEIPARRGGQPGLVSGARTPTARA